MPVTYRLMVAGKMDGPVPLSGAALRAHWDTLSPIGEDGPWSASQSPEVRRKHDESSSQGSDEESEAASEVHQGRAGGRNDTEPVETVGDSSSNWSLLDAGEQDMRRTQYAAEAIQDASKAIQGASGVEVLQDYYLETAMNLVCTETAEDVPRVCIGTFWGLAQGLCC